MCNPRNTYQSYAAAANTSGKTLWTYLGKLLPNLGNVTYGGAGELSPLKNDPEYLTIGVGTRIFPGGAQGFITGPGTQHTSLAGSGTLMVQGNLKEMSPDFICAASFPRYGCSLYVGLDILLPVLDAHIAAWAGISDEEITTSILDYSVPSHSRPVLAKVNYAQLKSGRIRLASRWGRTASLSSYAGALKVAETPKRQIEEGVFLLSTPVEPLPRSAQVQTLECTKPPAEERWASPEIDTLHPPFWDEAKCIHCGLCVSLCPYGVFPQEHEGTIREKVRACRPYRRCREDFPMQAIPHRGKELKSDSPCDPHQRDNRHGHGRRGVYIRGRN